MKKKTKILFASLLLGASFATVATGCNSLKGDYALTDFTVDASKVSLTYEIGDDVDLSGLVMKATFSDDETKTVAFADVKIYLGNEDITANLAKLTEVAGNKEIKIVYSTEYGEKSTTLPITVKEEEVVLDSIDTFNKPAFLVAYQDQLAKASDEDTTANEAVFFKNEVADGQTEPYKVGDDNAFKVLPVADAMDFETGDINVLTSVTVNSTVKLLVGNTYEPLIKTNKEGEAYTYEYYQGETLLLTEYAAKNEFDFADEALGKVFNLSILPDTTVYEVDSDTDAIVLVVEVVDGYNVYNTKELSVLDNSKRKSWADYKGQNGIANVNTNGVVLHNTMALTVADIPEDFYYTLPDDYNVKYVDEKGVSKTPEEWGMGRTFLYQHFDNYETNPEDEPSGNDYFVLIYTRTVEEGQTFSFYGNYFEVDASQIPLVCAFAPTGNIGGVEYTEDDTYYGDDFSNAVLFTILGKEQKWTCGEHTEASNVPLTKCSTCGKEVTKVDVDETFYFDNLAIKGNAQNKQLRVDVNNTENAVQDKECLVFAGGIILTRVNNMQAKLDNVRTYNFFISFFANEGADVEYNRTKCFDSFQNAIFVWGSANVDVKKSIFKRAGGPLVIMQHYDADEGSLAIPHMTVDSASVMYSALTGSEIWFKSVGATAVVSMFQGLDAQIFNNFGKTIFLDGKMNIAALLMQDGTDAMEAILSTDAQGSFFYGDDATDTTAPRLDRMANTVLGATVRSLLNPWGNALQSIDQLPPVINVGSEVFYATQNGIFDVKASTDATTSAANFYAALSTAKYVGFNYGGLSILFELGTVSAS